MLRHPAIKQVNSNQVRAGSLFVCGPLFQSLGLSSAQVDEFLRLSDSWHFYGTKDGKPVILASDITEKESERQLRSLLGETGYAQYRTTAEAWPSLSLAAELASALAFSDSPLTPEQSQQILQLAKAHQVPSGKPAPEWNYFLDWDAIAAQSAAILSAEQQAALQMVRAARTKPTLAAQPAPSK